MQPSFYGFCFNFNLAKADYKIGIILAGIERYGLLFRL